MPFVNSWRYTFSNAPTDAIAHDSSYGSTDAVADGFTHPLTDADTISDSITHAVAHALPFTDPNSGSGRRPGSHERTLPLSADERNC